MMIAALVTSAVVLLAAPGVAARFGRRVHPADWTRWSFGSLLVSPGDLGYVGVWTKGAVPHVTRLRVAELSGSDAPGGAR